MVSRLNGVQEAAGSNPVTRTKKTAENDLFSAVFCIFLRILPNFSRPRSTKRSTDFIFADSTAEKKGGLSMASIIEVTKNGKLCSYKLKACVGRDVHGKQVFRCMTWYIPENLSPSKARKAAEKAANNWEETVRQEFEAEQQARQMGMEYHICSPAIWSIKTLCWPTTPLQIRLHTWILWKRWRLFPCSGYSRHTTRWISSPKSSLACATPFERFAWRENCTMAPAHCNMRIGPSGFEELTFKQHRR